MNSDMAMEKPARVGPWVVSLRAPFLTASAIPALLGALAAYWRTGTFSISRFLLSLTGVLFIHLGANMANDFFDEITGCDRTNPEPTPFSGGSRVIQKNLLSSSVVLASSILFFVIGTVQGLLLNHLVPGNIILKIGLTGLALGILYTATPAKLSYRGFGEVAVLVAFGPLLVSGAYASQTGYVDGFAVFVGLPAGLLVTSILLINELLDEKWDRVAGKRNLIVLFGPNIGFILYVIVFISAYVLIAIGIWYGIFVKVAALGFLPLLPYCVAISRKGLLERRDQMIKLSGMTIMAQIVTTAVIAIGYLFPPHLTG